MLRATIIKDTLLLCRDRGSLLSLFALPLVFMATFGSMFQGHYIAAPGSLPPAATEALAASWQGDGFQLAVPANAVLFGFFLSLTMSLSFMEERRSGTWIRLQAAPVSPWLLLIAKLVPYFIIGTIQMALLFGAGIVAFGLEISGSIPALVILCLALVWAAVSLGLFFASFATSERMLGSVGSIALLIMGILGGTMLPRVAMPESMQTLGLLTPHAWALDGFQDLLVSSQTGMADVLPSLFVLGGFGVFFSTVATLRFRSIVHS